MNILNINEFKLENKATNNFDKLTFVNSNYRNTNIALQPPYTLKKEIQNLIDIYNSKQKIQNVTIEQIRKKIEDLYIEINSYNNKSNYEFYNNNPESLVELDSIIGFMPFLPCKGVST